MELLNNQAFARDFATLRGVALNPERHSAPNAQAHTLLVVERVRWLCAQNGVLAEDAQRLIALAYLHDIGKAYGTSHPRKSLELLPAYGVSEPALAALVKYHDVNLPWYQSLQRGEAPSDKAWSKLARQVDMRLLCLFMIADRVDCPGGFRANAPLCWFLAEAHKRGFLSGTLNSHEQELRYERSAGVVLRDPQDHVLLLHRHGRYEVPKGHIEPGESEQDAALRELREETSCQDVVLGRMIGRLQYVSASDLALTLKEVVLFLGRSHVVAQRASVARAHWLARNELARANFVSAELRECVLAVFVTESEGIAVAPAP